MSEPTMRPLEALGYLSCSRITLWRYVRKGLLTPIPNGKRSVFLKSELDQVKANPPKAGNPNKKRPR